MKKILSMAPQYPGIHFTHLPSELADVPDASCIGHIWMLSNKPQTHTYTKGTIMKKKKYMYIYKTHHYILFNRINLNDNFVFQKYIWTNKWWLNYGYSFCNGSSWNDTINSRELYKTCVTFVTSFNLHNNLMKWV